MNFNLVCIHPFHGYAKGQMITDPKEIAKLLDEDRDHHFVKIAKPPAPAPAATK